MNAREGFRRIEIFYYRRWWVIVLVPAGAFLYRYLSGAAPLDIDPDLWFWLRPCFLSAISVFALIVGTWIVAGFLTPSDAAQSKRRSQ